MHASPASSNGKHLKRVDMGKGFVTGRAVRLPWEAAVPHPCRHSQAQGRGSEQWMGLWVSPCIAGAGTRWPLGSLPTQTTP